MSARLACLGVVLASGLLAGCERAMHEMYDQPKYEPLEPSTLFADGNSSRPQVPGTMVAAKGETAAMQRGFTDPLPVTPALLARGRERFDIYCAPCHSRAGDGDGMLPRRGFPSPPSYHSERLRNVSDGYLYQVIRDGYGAMYPYGDRIAPHDRWAIVSYIRALQLSQHAAVSALGADDRRKLEEATR
ncbi:MAG: cytochrome c [Burkholderiaceae bacterium]|nr:cytochrome c [Burkholderiaceae bacterium]